MAKMFLRVNPTANSLTEYAKFNQKQITKDQDGNLVEDTKSMNLARTPGTRLRLCANPSRKKRGRLNTGLDVMVSNPYSDAKTFPSADFENVLKGKDQALQQHILEYKWKKPFNYLRDENTDVMALDVKDTASLSAFQKDEYVLELTMDTHIIDTDTEFGDIFQHVLKASSLIANSFEERNSNTPYYISHEVEEETIKQTKSLSADKAISKLVSLLDTNKEQLINFGKVLDLNVLNQNETKAYNLIKDFVIKSKESANLFLKLHGLWENPSTKSQFVARVILWEAKQYGIIIKEGVSWNWYPPKDEEGNPQEKREFTEYTGDNSIIEFLSSEKYASFQKIILEQIKRKKNN